MERRPRLDEVNRTGQILLDKWEKADSKVIEKWLEGAKDCFMEEHAVQGDDEGLQRQLDQCSAFVKERDTVESSLKDMKEVETHLQSCPVAGIQTWGQAKLLDYQTQLEKCSKELSSRKNKVAERQEKVMNFKKDVAKVKEWIIQVNEELDKDFESKSLKELESAVEDMKREKEDVLRKEVGLKILKENIRLLAKKVPSSGRELKSELNVELENYQLLCNRIQGKCHTLEEVWSRWEELLQYLDLETSWLNTLEEQMSSIEAVPDKEDAISKALESVESLLRHSGDNRNKIQELGQTLLDGGVLEDIISEKLEAFNSRYEELNSLAEKKQISLEKQLTALRETDDLLKVLHENLLDTEKQLTTYLTDRVDALQVPEEAKRLQAVITSHQEVLKELESNMSPQPSTSAEGRTARGGSRMDVLQDKLHEVVVKFEQFQKKEDFKQRMDDCKLMLVGVKGQLAVQDVEGVETDVIQTQLDKCMTLQTTLSEVKLELENITKTGRKMIEQKQTEDPKGLEEQVTSLNVLYNDLHDQAEKKQISLEKQLTDLREKDDMPELLLEIFNELLLDTEKQLTFYMTGRVHARHVPEEAKRLQTVISSHQAVLKELQKNMSPQQWTSSEGRTARGGSPMDVLQAKLHDIVVKFEQFQEQEAFKQRMRDCKLMLDSVQEQLAVQDIDGVETDVIQTQLDKCMKLQKTLSEVKLELENIIKTGRKMIEQKQNEDPKGLEEQVTSLNVYCNDLHDQAEKKQISLEKQLTGFRETDDKLEVLYENLLDTEKQLTTYLTDRVDALQVPEEAKRFQDLLTSHKVALEELQKKMSPQPSTSAEGSSARGGSRMDVLQAKLHDIVVKFEQFQEQEAFKQRMRDCKLMLDSVQEQLAVQDIDGVETDVIQTQLDKCMKLQKTLSEVKLELENIIKTGRKMIEQKQNEDPKGLEEQVTSLNVYCNDLHDQAEKKQISLEKQLTGFRETDDKLEVLYENLLDTEKQLTTYLTDRVDALQVPEEAKRFQDLLTSHKVALEELQKKMSPQPSTSAEGSSARGGSRMDVLQAKLHDIVVKFEQFQEQEAFKQRMRDCKLMLDSVQEQLAVQDIDGVETDVIQTQLDKCMKLQKTLSEVKLELENIIKTGRKMIEQKQNEDPKGLEEQVTSLNVYCNDLHDQAEKKQISLEKQLTGFRETDDKLEVLYENLLDTEKQLTTYLTDRVDALQVPEEAKRFQDLLTSHKVALEELQKKMSPQPSTSAEGSSARGGSRMDVLQAKLHDIVVKFEQFQEQEAFKQRMRDCKLMLDSVQEQLAVQDIDGVETDVIQTQLDKCMKLQKTLSEVKLELENIIKTGRKMIEQKQNEDPKGLEEQVTSLNVYCNDLHDQAEKKQISLEKQLTGFRETDDKLEVLYENLLDTEKQLTTYLTDRVDALQVPEEAKRFQDLLTSHKVALEELQKKMSPQPSTSAEGSSARGGSRMDVLQAKLHDIVVKFEQFQEQEAFKQRMRDCKLMLDVVQEQLAVQDIEGVETDVIQTQLDKCMKLQKTLSEVKLELENIIKTGRKMIEQKQTEDPKGLEEQVTSLNVYCNDLHDQAEKRQIYLENQLTGLRERDDMLEVLHENLLDTEKQLTTYLTNRVDDLEFPAEVKRFQDLLTSHKVALEELQKKMSPQPSTSAEGSSARGGSRMDVLQDKLYDIVVKFEQFQEQEAFKQRMHDCKLMLEGVQGQLAVQDVETDVIQTQLDKCMLPIGQEPLYQCLLTTEAAESHLPFSDLEKLERDIDYMLKVVEKHLESGNEDEKMDEERIQIEEVLQRGEQMLHQPMEYDNKKEEIRLQLLLLHTIYNKTKVCRDGPTALKERVPEPCSVSQSRSAHPGAPKVVLVSSASEPPVQAPHTSDISITDDLDKMIIELAYWLILIDQTLKSNIVTVGDVEEINKTITRMNITMAGLEQCRHQLGYVFILAKHLKDKASSSDVRTAITEKLEQLKNQWVSTRNDMELRLQELEYMMIDSLQWCEHKDETEELMRKYEAQLYILQQARRHPLIKQIIDNQILLQGLGPGDEMVMELDNILQELLREYDSDDTRIVKETTDYLKSSWINLKQSIADRQNSLEADLRIVLASRKELDNFLKWLLEAEATVNVLVAASKLHHALHDSAFAKRLTQEIEDIQVEIDAHNDIFKSIDGNRQKIIQSLGNSRKATMLQNQLDDMNQRWNNLKAKPTSIRARIEASDEKWKRLMMALEELIKWLNMKDEELKQQMPIGKDILALQLQSDYCKTLRCELEEKEYSVLSAISQARVFLTGRPIEVPKKLRRNLQLKTELTPEERPRTFAIDIHKQSSEVKEKWESLKAVTSNWQKQVDKALKKLRGRR